MTKKNEGKSQAEIYREERKARLAKASAKQAKKSPKRLKAERTFVKATPIVIVAVLAVVLLGWVLNFAGIPQRTATAMKVGDIKVSQAEYTYYYRLVSGQYINTATQYDAYFGAGAGKQYIGYDPALTPDKQEYSSTVTQIEMEKKADGSVTTWEDFFVFQTQDTIQRFMAVYNEAEKAGMKLSDSDKKTIDEQINSIREEAAEADFTLNAYLRAAYGKGVNEKIVRKAMETQSLVDAYITKMSSDFENGYSDADLEKAYTADKYDVVTMRTFLVEVDADVEEGESLDATNKKKEEAKKEAKSVADAMLKKVTDEKSFKEQALKNAPKDEQDDYKEDGATLYRNANSEDVAKMDEKVKDWAFDKARKAGDKTVVETESGYYVLYMVAPRGRNMAETVDVRHILLSTEEAKDDAAKAEVKKNAEDLLAQWKKGGATQEAFAQLATEKTEDTGSAETGGLYENVAKGDMVEAFDAWIFDESRKPGDSGIVETNYGYHIMYFVEKNNEPVWKSQVRKDKGTEDSEKKLDSLVKSDEYKVKAKNHVIKKVIKAANDSFKSAAYNSSKG